MSSARSGSDWACKDSSTSDGVNPGRSLLIHESKCFSDGVRVRGLGFGRSLDGCEREVEAAERGLREREGRIDDRNLEIKGCRATARIATGTQAKSSPELGFKIFTV